MLDEWRYLRGESLDFTWPGKPTESGPIYLFNGRLRDECLNVNEFATVAQVWSVLRSWRHDYTHHRPHGSRSRLRLTEIGMKGQRTVADASKL